MRAVGERMIVAPPLVITLEEIAILGKRIERALDLTYQELKDRGAL
jgi:putrescine aminotransferase